MQVVIKELESIDYNEEEVMVVEELENVDYDEESLVEWDGPALHGSRNWTSEEITILLKYIFKKRLNCAELQELGLLRKNQAI
nr:8328_t:CDS:2 [Entrophospora candida]